MSMSTPYAIPRPKTVGMMLFATLAFFTLLGCNSGGSSTDGSSISTTSQEPAGQQLANDALVLAVNGRGYLVMRDQSGGQVFRRLATFGLDANGFIVTSAANERLQGNGTAENGMIIPGVPGDLSIVDIDPATIEIDENGLIFFTQDGELTILGQINVASFSGSYLLNEIEPGLFVYTTGSGEPAIGAPGTAGLGTLSVGSDDVPPLDNTLELESASSYLLLQDIDGDSLYAASRLLFSDAEGYIIDEFANRLLVFPPVDELSLVGEETIDYGTLSPLQLSGYDLEPADTTQVTLTANLNGLVTDAAVTPFDPMNESSYNSSDVVEIYDTQGNPHEFTLYFARSAFDNEWQLYYAIDLGQPMEAEAMIGGPYALEFDTQGGLITNPAVVQTQLLDFNNGTVVQTLDIDFSGITQRPESFSAGVEQNGYPPGRASGSTLEGCGRIVQAYSNGVDRVVGQVALANFSNPAELAEDDNGLLLETVASGSPILGAPCADGFDALVEDDID